MVKQQQQQQQQQQVAIHEHVLLEEEHDTARAVHTKVCAPALARPRRPALEVGCEERPWQVVLDLPGHLNVDLRNDRRADCVAERGCHLDFLCPFVSDWCVLERASAVRRTVVDQHGAICRDFKVEVGRVDLGDLAAQLWIKAQLPVR
eukprot:SAG31_NODE_3512_length_4172_cov_30.849251_4_plen_148_part_00